MTEEQQKVLFLIACLGILVFCWHLGWANKEWMDARYEECIAQGGNSILCERAVYYR
jgi:TRAP-type C4-dicarboxylate transport system permease small subunit